MPRIEVTTETKNRISKYNNIQSALVQKYITGVSIRNQKTAIQYHSRLLVFEKFVEEKYRIDIDKLIQKLRNREYDPYDVLNDFVYFYRITIIISDQQHSEIK